MRSVFATRAILAVAVAACSAVDVDAQRLVIDVRDSVLRTGVSGALVTAVERATGTQVFGLTNDAGRARIALPVPGVWHVSSRRIGVASSRAAPIRVDSGQTLMLVLATTSTRFTLPAVRVTASAGTCARAPDGDDRTSVLWAQVTLALRASTTAAHDGAQPARLRVQLFERTLDRAGKRVAERPLRSGAGAGRPFYAANADTLAQLGYVRRDADGSLQYFAPDERVLLSDAFIRTHCFDAPASDADGPLARLEFRPAPGHSSPDVAGTAFIDASTGELQRIEFRYVGVDRLFDGRRPDAGGDVELRRLVDGTWIVSGWTIRMPIYLRVPGRVTLSLTGYREVGGAAAVSDATVVTPGAQALGDSMPGMPLEKSIAEATVVSGRSGSARAIAARSGFTMRRSGSPGVFLDSGALARAPAPTALRLLLLVPELSFLRVPDDTPSPPADNDADLAREWRAGVDLPMVRIAGTDSATRFVCLVKVFLDGRRVSIAQLDMMPAAHIAALEFYRLPQHVPADFRRQGNRCGTALFWSY